MTNTSKISVLDEERALTLYLEALFRDPVATPEVTTNASADMTAAAPAPQTGLDPATAVASDEIQALLLRLSGANLAVTVDAVEAVIKWPDTVYRMSRGTERPQWLIVHRGERVVVLDTEAALFRQRAAQEGEDSDANGYTHIAILHNAPLGLACYGADKILQVKNDAVVHGYGKNSHPWIAGLIKEHLCVLLDTDALVASQTRKRNNMNQRDPFISDAV